MLLNKRYLKTYQEYTGISECGRLTEGSTSLPAPFATRARLTQIGGTRVVAKRRNHREAALGVKSLGSGAGAWIGTPAPAPNLLRNREKSPAFAELAFCF